MSDFALDFGQKFTVDGTEFEVVSIASNDGTGETVFEVMTSVDAEKRRERNQPEPAEVPEQETLDLVEGEVAPEPQAPVAPAPTTMLVK